MVPLSRRKRKSFLFRMAIIAPFVWFGIAIGLLFATRKDISIGGNPKSYLKPKNLITKTEDGENPWQFPNNDFEYFYRPELGFNDGFDKDEQAAADGDILDERNTSRRHTTDLRLSSEEDGAGDYENGSEEAFEGANSVHRIWSDGELYLHKKTKNRHPKRGSELIHRKEDDELLVEKRDHVNSEEYEEDSSYNYDNRKMVGDSEMDRKRKSRPVESLIRVYDKTRMKYLNITWPHVPLTGLGEYGKTVTLNPRNSAEKKEKDEGLATHHFNQFVSDRISVIRNMMDHRLPECKTLTRRDNLPDTSVVIVFHNEAWTTLLRTVYSVLNRTPPQLLKEIILVDDFSDFDFLKLSLDAYMAQFEKVKVVHTIKREGLIRARLIGIDLSTGETLTFLDSHCECNIGWIEPLLDRVADDWSCVVTPIIDTIDEQTFAYHTPGRAYFAVGSFSWSMMFKWATLSQAEKERRTTNTEPARSPTMAGGLFTINRQYFHHIGLYDPGMEIWGGENLELSFRIWLCGGTLEIIPCSRVGHVFRKINPHLANCKGSPYKKNTLRLVETWLDDYKYLYYQSTGYYPKKYLGDIRERLNLKKKLNCKPFSWYLENIVPEMFDPKRALQSGLLQNEVQVMNHEYKCLAQQPNIRNPPGNRLKIKTCDDNNLQIFYLTDNKRLRQLEHCLEYIPYRKELQLVVCRKGKERQNWTLTEINQIRNTASGKCLAMSFDGRELTMDRCQNVPQQKWIWIDYRRVNT